mmetsp:Transcript_12512/g.19686  ORF Transcript_12512/g.19686 Transcript_12512/m.19686 type:complete len:192 (-) Transcript_12512:46-621(-)
MWPAQIVPLLRKCVSEMTTGIMYFLASKDVAGSSKNRKVGTIMKWSLRAGVASGILDLAMSPNLGLPGSQPGLKGGANGLTPLALEAWSAGMRSVILLCSLMASQLEGQLEGQSSIGGHGSYSIVTHKGVKEYGKVTMDVVKKAKIKDGEILVFDVPYDREIGVDLVEDDASEYRNSEVPVERKGWRRRNH